MKNIVFYIIGIGVFQNYYAIAQQANYPCVNQVSTDYGNESTGPMSTNNALPINPTPTGQSDFGNRFLNSFDWLPFLPDLQLADYLTSGIANLSQHNNRMLNIYNTSYSSFYNRFQREMDMGFLPIPENGWELLAVNLGFYPNGEPFALYNTPNQHSLLPYIILYNKYTATIRIFAKPNDNWVLNNYWTSARVIMSVDDQPYVNGLLRYISGLDKALDQQTSVIEYSAVCAVDNQPNQWLAADFQVAFDPCVCTWPSRIRFDFQLIQKEDIVLHGGAISIEREILNGNQVAHNDYLSNFTGKFTNATNGQFTAEGGFVIYREMQAMIDDYIAKLEKYKLEMALVDLHNKEVDRKIAILKYASAAISVALAVVTGGSTTSIAVAIIASLGAVAPDLVTKDSDGNITGVKHEKTIKEAEKAIADASKHYQSSNWKKQNLPSRPITPTATFTEMYFEGSITSTAHRAGPRMYTPGSYGEGNAWSIPIPNTSDYPVYNDILGVFALLKTPKVKISENVLDQNLTQSAYHVPSQGVDVKNIYQSWTKEYQIQLDSELEYVFNPALDIVSSSIECSFEIQSNVTRKANYVTNDSLKYGVFIDPLRTVNMNSVDVDVTTFFPLESPLGKNYQNGSNFCQVFLNNDDCFSEYWQHAGEVDTVLNSFNLNSEFLPIDFFKNSISAFSIKNQYHDTRIYFSQQDLSVMLPPIDVNSDGYDIDFKVFLKLLVNITYNNPNNQSGAEEHVYVLTYEIPLEDDYLLSNQSLINNLAGSEYDYTQYPALLNFVNTSFDGSQINGCNLDNSVYTCIAREQILISGNLNTANNHIVFLQAGEEILVEGESEISPEINMSIIPVLINPFPMPPADEDRVKSFCSNIEEYQANILQRSVANYYDSLVQANPAPEPLPDPIEFILFPNPTTGASQAGIYLPELATVSITIIDVSGKVVGSPVQNVTLANGRNVQNLETESLQPGVYLVHLVVNGEKFVQRLVKQ